MRLEECLQAVRKKAPLIHCITNYVTVNDCVNLLLAAGASPIMADEEEEVEEITSICDGLLINIGTLNRRTIPAMIKAGKKAARLAHPIVLDPVGAGASRLRTQTARQLLEEIPFTVIRGNLSELKALAGSAGVTHGVDAAQEDRITEENVLDIARFALQVSEQTGAVTAITGPIDIVAKAGKNPEKSGVILIRNGTPLMSRVTGTGCQLSALLAAFAAACPERPLEAAAAAVASMGLCGETAEQRMQEGDGNASYRTYIIDAICNLDEKQLKAGLRAEKAAGLPEGARI